MTKDRARRRATRVAEQQKEQRAARTAKATRVQKRRAARQQTKPRRGRVGQVGLRRSRAQRIGIGVAAGLAGAVIWMFADVGLAIGLTALMLLVLPAVVVLLLGRRY